MQLIALVASTIAMAVDGGQSCPCKIGDVEYSTIEGDKCKPQLDLIAHSEDFIARHPGFPRQPDPYLAFRVCVNYVRSRTAQRQKSDQGFAEMEAKQAAEREAREARDRKIMAQNLANIRAQQEQQAEQARMMESMRSDPKSMEIALSAAICYDADLKSRSLSEVRKEQKYARIGGVSDKGKLYELQQLIRNADESSADARARLKLMRLAARGCRQSIVQAVVSCMNGDECHEDVSVLAKLVEVPTD